MDLPGWVEAARATVCEQAQKNLFICIHECTSACVRACLMLQVCRLLARQQEVTLSKLTWSSCIVLDLQTDSTASSHLIPPLMRKLDGFCCKHTHAHTHTHTHTSLHPIIENMWLNASSI